MSRREPSLDAAARQLVAIAELDDIRVTGMMRQAVETTGGELVGVDHRVKPLESLARKLADLLRQDPDLGVEEAGSEVYDVLRFTVVADIERYRDVHDVVLRRSYAERVQRWSSRSNRWAGPGYRGINVRLRDGNRRFEVQFHTRESFEAARTTRGYYEERRLEETLPERKDELRQMIDVVFSNGPGTTPRPMMDAMSRDPVEFYVSNIGGPEPRVLARFTRNERGLYMERFDRRAGRWVPDSSIAGFDIGFDDWAERASGDRAEEILAGWGSSPPWSTRP